MHIVTNIKVLNKGYQIFVDNKSYVIDDFYYKCLLPYNNKELNDETFYQLICFSDAYMALKTLYKKIYKHTISKSDFKKELKKANLTDSTINTIVDVFTQENYLDDKLFCENSLTVYVKSKGVNAYVSFLKLHGIEKQLIDKYQNLYEEDIDHALNYANAFIKNKCNSKNMLIIKIKNSLSAKGFSEKTIKQVISQLNFSSDINSLIKEYEKIQKKYPNDHHRTISKLLLKGYNMDDIKKIVTESDFNED